MSTNDPTPERRAREAQARYAERLTARPDDETPTIRRIELDGREVGRVIYVGDDEWQLFYVEHGRLTDAHHSLAAPLADPEDNPDRHGVGEVADALARGYMQCPKL